MCHWQVFERMDIIKDQQATARVKLGTQVTLKAVTAVVARHMYDYNTVESTLLGSAVFVCLAGVCRACSALPLLCGHLSCYSCAGIMFQSGQFASANFASQREALTFLVIFVIVFSFVYAIAVFVHDVLVVLKPNCCVRKSKSDRRHIAEHLQHAQENRQTGKRAELEQVIFLRD